MILRGDLVVFMTVYRQPGQRNGTQCFLQSKNDPFYLYRYRDLFMENGRAGLAGGTSAAYSCDPVPRGKTCTRVA
jgi:hypothetical protein